MPKEVHEAELAGLLGLNRQRVGELVRNGVLKRTGRARFDLHDAVGAYCANLREKAGRLGNPSGKSPANAKLNAEKVRLTAAQADERELKLAAARRELLPAKEVQREWAEILGTIRAGLLAVPSRVGVRLGHLTAHDLSEIDAEIRDVLAELAEGNPDET